MQTCRGKSIEPQHEGRDHENKDLDQLENAVLKALELNQQYSDLSKDESEKVVSNDQT